MRGERSGMNERKRPRGVITMGEREGGRKVGRKEGTKECKMRGRSVIIQL